MNAIIDAWRFAEACSHDDPHECEEIAAADIYVPVRNDLDFGYLAEYPDRIVFAMKGTQRNIKDWCQNFRIVPDPFGRHRGFAECASWFVNPVLEYLRNVHDKPVLFTGHSQGGALVTMLADLIGQIDNPLSIVSFGTPPSGIEGYLERLRRYRIDRVVCMEDIVECDFIPIPREGIRTGLRYTRFPLFACVRDHAYSSYTRGLINLCRKLGDAEGERVMRAVLRRCKI